MTQKSKAILVIALAVIAAVCLFLLYHKPGLLSTTPQKTRTIGILYFRQHLDAYDGLKQGMKDLGYTDQNLKYEEVLLTPGPTLYTDIDNGVKKLLADKVDLIWVSMEHQGLEAINITKATNNNTPIVFMARFHDPLSFGLIQSYKSSGNNSTGVATDMPQNVEKVLQFYKEINPNIKKVGVFGAGFMVPPNFGDVYLAELKKQAPKFGMSVVEYTTNKPPDTTGATWHEVAATIKPGDIDALFHIAVHFYDPQETAELALATKLGIPHAVPSEDLPTGGMFSYSDDYSVSAKQSAVMIDKIFHGTKPSDIPIEFGSKQVLSLNIKRAAAAGITFPASMLNIAEVKITQ